MRHEMKLRADLKIILLQTAQVNTQSPLTMKSCYLPFKF